MHTNQIGKSFSLALIAVLYKLGLPDLCATGRLFKFKGGVGAMNEKYILYARKSTDVEDKQVLSIEAQIAELREFAKRENLNVVDVLIEKQSAKIPGRLIFNEMISRIENEDINGIISWHPD